MMVANSNYLTSSLTAIANETIEVICNDGYIGGGLSTCVADDIWTNVSSCVGRSPVPIIYYISLLTQSYLET